MNVFTRNKRGYMSKEGNMEMPHKVDLINTRPVIPLNKRGFS